MRSAFFPAAGSGGTGNARGRGGSSGCWPTDAARLGAPSEDAAAAAAASAASASMEAARGMPPAAPGALMRPASCGAATAGLYGTPIKLGGGGGGSGGAGSYHHSASPGGVASAGLRFPTSRRYLWDRTPAGPQVLVATHDLLPQLSISAAALAAVARAASTAAAAAGARAGATATAPADAGNAASAEVQLRLCLATTSSFQLSGLLVQQQQQQQQQRLGVDDGAADAGCVYDAQAGAQAGAPCGFVQVACRVFGPGDEASSICDAAQAALEAAGGGDDALASALAARVDAHGPTKVSQLFALSLCAVPSAARLSCGGRPLQQQQQQQQQQQPPALLGRIALPSAGLLLTPLFNKRLCAGVPLSEMLLRLGGVPAGATGFLSMDQGRSLLPLDGADAAARSTPLVGVWVKGPDSPLHPLAAAACLRFFYTSTLLDRALQGPEGDAFLLLLLPEGSPGGKCYEARPTEPRKLPLASFSLFADLDPAAQLDRFPGGLVPLEWSQDARPLPPLALPPPPPPAHPNASMLASFGGGSPPLPAALEALGRARLTASAGAAGALFAQRCASPAGAPAVSASASASASAGLLHRYARPGSGSSAGTACAGAGMGDVCTASALSDSHHQWLRASAAPPPPPQQQQWRSFDAGGGWSIVEAPSEDDGGVSGDGVCVGSPLRPVVAAGAWQAQAQQLPVLLGGPAALSPTRHAALARGGTQPPWGPPRDLLRDSLDSGQRCVTAAAAAIANAEAAVMRASGGGSPQRLAQHATLMPVRVAACTSPTPPPLPPAASLVLPAAAASCGGGGGGGGGARELQEEVVRLRAELSRLQQMLQDATLPPPPAPPPAAALPCKSPPASPRTSRRESSPSPRQHQQQQQQQQQHPSQPIQQQQQQQQQQDQAAGGAHSPSHSAASSADPGARQPQPASHEPPLTHCSAPSTPPAVGAGGTAGASPSGRAVEQAPGLVVSSGGGGGGGGSALRRSRLSHSSGVAGAGAEHSGTAAAGAPTAAVEAAPLEAAAAARPTPGDSPQQSPSPSRHKPAAPPPGPLSPGPRPPSAGASPWLRRSGRSPQHPAMVLVGSSAASSSGGGGGGSDPSSSATAGVAAAAAAQSVDTPPPQPPPPQLQQQQPPPPQLQQQLQQCGAAESPATSCPTSGRATPASFDDSDGSLQDALDAASLAAVGGVAASPTVAAAVAGVAAILSAPSPRLGPSTPLSRRAAGVDGAPAAGGGGGGGGVASPVARPASGSTASPRGRSGSALRASSALASVVAGASVIRTRITPLSSDAEDDDDAELEARLARKYGVG